MSFNISLSGINASSANLAATANNIANVNTAGFKEQRAEFANIFNSGASGLSANAVGAGVRIAGMSQQFTQGNISDTGRSLDLAVSGEGFFTLSQNGERIYSRAGNFQTDANGYVVNPQGARLQVYAAKGDGTFDIGQLSDLRLLTTDSTPRATQNLELAFTLPANSPEPVVSPFDPANANSYNQSSGGMTVYDSLGVAHTQTSYFVKTANPNEWMVHNYIDGTAVGTPTTVQFSDSGALVSPAEGEIAMNGFTPTSGAAAMNIALNITGSTQYGDRFSLRNTTQDGYASGKLTDVSISEDGIAYARYSNGVDSPLGQVALTTFNNNQGLKNLGNNAWAESFSSGSPRTGAPNSSDFGAIQAGSLEESTVDLTEQLVNMITAQRNFQANAQMLSTQNEVTQAIINIR